MRIHSLCVAICFLLLLSETESAFAQDTAKSTASSSIVRPTLRVRAYAQLDGQFFLQDHQEVSTSSFILRRVRPIFEGEAGKLFSYFIMPDFGAGVTVIQDARLDIRFAPEIRLRLGKFKAPVGLERLQSATDMSFIFRATPTLLVPNRDIGAQVFGEAFDSRLSYALGIFNGVLDGSSADADVDDNKEGAGRIFAEPWKSGSGGVLSGLGVGIAGTYGNQVGTTSSPNVPTYRTGGGQTFFRFRSDGTDAGTVMANGEKYRVTPQAYFYYDWLGIMAEYAVSSQAVRRGGSTLHTRSGAWQITALFALTGERLSFRGLQPRESFDPETGGLGAFELSARYMRLNVKEDVFPFFADPRTSMRALEGWSLALHWYMSANVKWIVNYEQLIFESVAPGVPRDPEKAILVRVQVSV
jgi:phosphate-selective porin OprO/OprP